MTAVLLPTAAGLPLPPAPSTVVLRGAPANGRYVGRLARFDWSPLRGEFVRPGWWRRLHHKRWHYVGMGSEDLFIGIAIVDVGWCVTAFAYLFDRHQRRVLAEVQRDTLPGLGAMVSDVPAGGSSRLSLAGAQWELAERDGQLAVRVHARRLEVDALIDLRTPAPFLLAVGPIAGGVAHATQKSPALGVTGIAHAGGHRYDLSRATACLDSSNGLLARDTAWRWACAQSPRLGFNLQEGYFAGAENALWLDGELIPLGAARFRFDVADPLAPWRVHTDCGLLDLRFAPEGARQDKRNLLFASSRYVQPIGTFSGIVRAAPRAPACRVENLLGVTEDHASRW